MSEHIHSNGGKPYIKGCPGCLALTREYQRRWREAHPGAASQACLRYQAKMRTEDPSYDDAINARRRERYAARAEHFREQSRLWAAEHPEVRRRGHSLRRARKAGVESDGHDRMAVFTRDGGTCQICGVVLDPTNWHEDHVLPLVLGGSDTMANVQAACPPCNLAKGARIPA